MPPTEFLQLLARIIIGCSILTIVVQYSAVNLVVKGSRLFTRTHEVASLDVEFAPALRQKAMCYAYRQFHDRPPPSSSRYLHNPCRVELPIPSASNTSHQLLVIHT